MAKEERRTGREGESLEPSRTEDSAHGAKTSMPHSPSWKRAWESPFQWVVRDEPSAEEKWECIGDSCCCSALHLLYCGLAQRVPVSFPP